MEKKMTDYLNAVYQNTKTAMQSIENIIMKVKDEELISELSREQEEYSKLAQACETFAKKTRDQKHQRQQLV